MHLKSKVGQFRPYFALYSLILFLAVSTAIIARRLLPGPDPNPSFEVGEWLINYHGGFVRRGLFGELLLHAFNLNEPWAGYTLLLIQISLYMTVTILLYNFMWRERFSFSSIALCCSPAVGLFIFGNVGITRKELLGLFSLSLLVFFSRKQSLRFDRLKWLAIIMFAISCFSSEINAFFLPSFVYVLYVSKRNHEFSLQYHLQKISVVLISVVSLGLSVKFHGNSEIAKLLCLDVVDHGFSPEICEGNSAISWLGVSITEVGPILKQHFPLYFAYLPLISLSFIPIILTPWFRSNWKWCLTCLTFILPLYLVALDYGRWTFMLVTQIVMMITATKGARIDHSIWNKFTVPIFTLAWGLPYFAQPDSSLQTFLLDYNFISTTFKLFEFAIR